jgi:hypothetical protein
MIVVAIASDLLTIFVFFTYLCFRIDMILMVVQFGVLQVIQNN